MPFALTALLLAASTTIAPAKPKPNVIIVRAMEFAFEAPAAVRPGLTTFRLVNGGKQLHHLTVVKLMDGKTVADYLKAMQVEGPMPSWAVEMGGPNTAIPGNTIDATIDLAPGNYALVCFVPSPGEHMPHFMKGMIHPLTVRGSMRHAAQKEPDVDITLHDYSFESSAPLTAGNHVVRVTNSGQQRHEVVVVRVGKGHTIADVGKWVDGGLKGPPPGMPIAGMSPLTIGQSATFPVRLAPGTYGLICFLPDAKDGKMHAEHGMVQQFEVAAK